MRKFLLLSTFILLTFFISQANAFSKPLDRVRVPDFPEGFTFGLGLVYYQPTVPFLDYAETANRDDSFFGLYHNDDCDYNNGILASFRYTFPHSGNDLLFNYSGIERHYNEAIRAQPEERLLRTLADTRVVFNGDLFVVFRGGTFVEIFGITAEINAAKIDSRFDYNSFSVEFGQHLAVNQLVRLRFFGGLQYANISQKFVAQYTGSGSKSVVFVPIIPTPFPLPPVPIVTGTLNVDQVVEQYSEFHGIGPYFGAELYIPITNRLAFKSRLGTAILSGYNENRLHDHLIESITPTFNFFPIVSSVSTRGINFFIQNAKQLNRYRVVPNINGLLAIDCNIYSSDRLQKSINIEFGYRVDSYFSANDRMTGETFAFAQILPQQMNVSFNGPYANLAVTL